MATSDTSIVNSALAKLGAKQILSLDDDTREARLMKEQLPKIRDMLLRSHPWNFAIERAELAASSTSPEFGFDYKFQLPADCLRVLEIDTEDQEWQKEGTYVVSNSSTMFIKYVKKITQAGLYDANFSEVFALKLAADNAYAITQSTSLRDELNREYKEALREARSFDAQEGGTRQVYARKWLNARN